ncbi:hypothetical protein SH661x_002898 [Planctomicrobium sp. SH661]|uniref:hypothetical protein n=1 Tax=Planctomicrobium sp. SH661 TaxID=3448124 RepID=UPI003F5B53BD
MRARLRLNCLSLLGTLLLAGGLGIVTGSWDVFLISAAILIAIFIHDGDIRPGPQFPRHFR